MRLLYAFAMAVMLGSLGGCWCCKHHTCDCEKPIYGPCCPRDICGSCCGKYYPVEGTTVYPVSAGATIQH